MSYYINRVQFDHLNTVLRIFKVEERTKEEVLTFFSQPENRTFIEEEYDALKPFTVKEAIKLPNVEQRMAALRAFQAEEVVKDLKAKQLDKQIISKKQIRWDENLKPYEFAYDDEYTLYAVDAKTLGLNNWWRSTELYFVKCNCPSTDRQYYIYVAEEAAQNKDAIEAIAWTMRFNGQPLKKEQYLNLMYSET